MHNTTLVQILVCSNNLAEDAKNFGGLVFGKVVNFGKRSPLCNEYECENSIVIDNGDIGAGIRDGDGAGSDVGDV